MTYSLGTNNEGENKMRTAIAFFMVGIGVAMVGRVALSALGVWPL
ncbi:hypothetical protein AB0G00_24045 [Nocardia salmonicida]